MRMYFLGIGGVSMSALAIFAQKNGNVVSGSEENMGRGTEILKENNIAVDFDVNFDAIEAADVVVVSSAIKKNDPRFMFAQKCNKEIISRGQFLGQVSEDYENVIAIAGSHGKTTTTALVYEILRYAGKNPTLHLGGFRKEDEKNFEIGGKKFFVTEACEYCDNFLYLHPTISVITNIEKEHMDFFKTFSREVESFQKFKLQSRYVIDSCWHVKAKNVKHEQSGELSFSICSSTSTIHLHTKLCEEVNTQNIIYAYLVSKKLGISDDVFKSAVEHFEGVKTRFERMNCPTFDNCVCDYAHHPTEISKAISTMRNVFKNKNLNVIFQPHTYSRTKALLSEFVKVFEDVETVAIFKTYSAREKEEDGISGAQLAKILQEKQKNRFYFEDFQHLRHFLQSFQNSETAILFVGAGDLPTIAQKEGFFE